MAQKKAVDYKYSACVEDASKIVSKWFSDNKRPIEDNAIYVVWLAYIPNGYRCMMTSYTYPSMFFEIKRNMVTDEMICHVLKEVECMVEPSHSEVIVMHDRNSELI